MVLSLFSSGCWLVPSPSPQIRCHDADSPEVDDSIRTSDNGALVELGRTQGIRLPALQPYEYHEVRALSAAAQFSLFWGVGAWVRGCVSEWVRGCVDAWMRGCVGVGVGVRGCVSAGGLEKMFCGISF